MTDRINAFTVVLEEDKRDDDAIYIADAKLDRDILNRKVAP